MTRPHRIYQQVICPIDFSKASRAALRYAAAIAGRAKGRVTVLAVNDPLLASAAAAAAYDTARLAADTNKEMQRFVRRTVGTGGPEVRFALALGHPAREIEKAVARLGADLVVMGTHGLRGASKWFFGSTTEGVLRGTKVPVLAVPPMPVRRRTDDPSGGLSTWPGKTVLAPIELGNEAGADARAAAGAARSLGARAILLHVLEPRRLPPWMQVDAEASERDRLEAAQKQLSALARAAGHGTEWRVLGGDPVEEISGCVADTKAQLIVLTLKANVGPFSPRQGLITYRLLCSGTVPVLAMPGRRA